MIWNNKSWFQIIWFASIITQVIIAVGPGGRGQHVRFGWPDDPNHYDVTAKEAQMHKIFENGAVASGLNNFSRWISPTIPASGGVVFES